jgi:hypothetical protein
MLYRRDSHYFSCWCDVFPILLSFYLNRGFTRVMNLGQNINKTSKQPWWKHACCRLFCQRDTLLVDDDRGGPWYGMLLGVIFHEESNGDVSVAVQNCFYEFLQQKLWLGKIWPCCYVWARSGLVVLLVLMQIRTCSPDLDSSHTLPV